MHSNSDPVVHAADTQGLYFMSLFVLSYYRQKNPQTTDINNVKLTDLPAMMYTIPGNAALHLDTAHPPC